MPALDVFSAIEQRRAVKKFDPSHRMTEDEIRKLLTAAKLAPTAYNIQHSRFVVVTDPELRQELRAASWNQAQVTDAAILVIVCAHLKAWEHPEPYWANAPAEVQQRMSGMIHDYYTGKPEAQRDEGFRSAGMAAQTLMLAATAMGYDSCPMDGFNFDRVSTLIRLPEDHAVVLFVTIGRKAAEPTPRPTQIPYEESVIYDRFG